MARAANEPEILSISRTESIAAIARGPRPVTTAGRRRADDPSRLPAENDHIRAARQIALIPLQEVAGQVRYANSRAGDGGRLVDRELETASVGESLDRGSASRSDLSNCKRPW